MEEGDVDEWSYDDQGNELPRYSPAYEQLVDPNAVQFARSLYDKGLEYDEIMKKLPEFGHIRGGKMLTMMVAFHWSLPTGNLLLNWHPDMTEDEKRQFNDVLSYPDL